MAMLMEKVKQEMDLENQKTDENEQFTTDDSTAGIQVAAGGLDDEQTRAGV
jgi:hypothetical protein